jgi:hypothetical protein
MPLFVGMAHGARYTRSMRIILTVVGTVVIVGLVYIALGINSVITGDMTAKGYTVERHIAGRACGLAFICIGLAFFRALWLLRRPDTLNFNDRILRVLVFLVLVSLATVIPLLFVGIAL